MTTAIEQFTTPRMVAERLTLAHRDEIIRLHRDPLVMRTLSADGLPLSDDTTLAGLEQNDNHWREHQFGFWIFRDRSIGGFVGRGGLKWYRIDGEDVVGLAYAVISDRWGRGLATEMAGAVLDVGFGALRMDEIDSWTLPINAASQRVMEKLGYRYERDIVFAGLPHRFYRLTAGDRGG